MTNIAVISKTPDYKESFRSKKEVQQALSFDNPDFRSSIELDAIFIDGKTISYRDLPEIRSLHPNVAMYYKLSNVPTYAITKNIDVVCKGHNITLISEQYEAGQAVDIVLRDITSKGEISSQRVISFFGTHSGAGTSSTVFNVARSLGEVTKEKVLVLSLNPWDPSDYFLNTYEGSYLNDIKIELKNKNFNAEKLKRSIYQTKYFDHLAGNRDIKLQRFYQPEEIAHLIDVAKGCYDVILIDGGSHFDNACYAQAYLSADLKFLVTTQEEKGYRNYFPLIYQQLLVPIQSKSDDFILLLNKYQQNYTLINEKDLQDELEMSLLTAIPHQDVVGVLATRQGEFLYDIGEDDYKKSIHTIVNTLISKGQLTKIETASPVSEKKTFLDRIFKKKPEKVGASV